MQELFLQDGAIRFRCCSSRGVSAQIIEQEASSWGASKSAVPTASAPRLESIGLEEGRSNYRGRLSRQERQQRGQCSHGDLAGWP